MKKDIRLHCALFLLFLVVLSISSAQNSGPDYDKLDWNEPSFDFQETYGDSLVLWQERVVLHIANEHVGNDSPLFFKGYLLTGVQQNRYSFSGVLNLELLDGNGTVIKRQFHKVVDGMVEGHMELPKNIAPGKYYLKAYTRWMRNYGEAFFALKEILVGSPLSDDKETSNMSDIFITPEGGTLLSGHKNRLVIKISPFQATKMGQVGRILDDKRQDVATVNYYSTGIGTTIFKPMKDKLYQLELENGAIYPIPKAENQGYLLHVNNLDENNAKIRVTASSEVLGTGVTLLGTSGGIRYFEKQLDFKDGNILNVDLSKRDIPFGFFTLKLVDDVGTELAKRPIWIDEERLHIDIKPITSDTDESTYKIKVTDKTNSPVKTQVAVSAKKFESEHKIAFGDNSIYRSDLFTFPEIAIEDSNSTNRNRFLMDLNVLLSEIELNNSSSNEDHLVKDIKYPIQRGLELTGYAYDLNNKLLENTPIQIYLKTDHGVSILEAQSNSEGFIQIQNLDFTGTAEFTFRTEGSDTKSRLVKTIPAVKEEKYIFPQNLKFSEDEISKRANTESTDIANDTVGLIKLDEATVSENRINNIKGVKSIYGIEIPAKRVKYQDPKRPKSIAQLFAEMPNVFVRNVGGIDPRVDIPRAQGQVQWVIDGYIIPQDFDGKILGYPLNSLGPVLETVNAVDIDRIDLLLGSDAAIYGSRGSAGVFSITTRSASDIEFINRKDIQLFVKGYEPKVDFNSYMHDLSKRARENSNILYWNPKLETDENGEAIFRIPTSSQETVIQIEASTITPDGKIGSLSTNF